jgi:putative transposase
MAIRKVNFALGEFYHLYNRGNSKQKIFLDKEDHLRFISLLFACNSRRNFKALNLAHGESPYDFERGEEIVAIGAYCLMPNHFHILVRPLTEDGVSVFMQKVSTAYVMYFNKKYSRTGGLFEGKFKSEHAYSDRYLKYLFSYIHLNPIKMIDKDWKEKGIRNKKVSLDYLHKYQYSSYLDFKEVPRTQNKILQIQSFPEYFPNKIVFEREIFDWMDYRNPLGKT